MNPGVQATILTIVLLILTATGWGERTLRDAGWSKKRGVMLLVLYLFLIGWTIPLPGELHLDLGGILMPLFLAGWTLGRIDNWPTRLQWLMATLTVSSSMVVLMTLVPLDPAFFPLEGRYLYPAVAALVAVASVRRPFIALTIGAVGVSLGSWIDPFIHDRMDLNNVVLGGNEMRDMFACAAVGVLFGHGPYHAASRRVTGLFRNWFVRRQEGGPEHV